MISINDARGLAGRRLLSKLGAWAGALPEDPVFSLSLRPPTEREMLADQGAAERWARSWDSSARPEGLEVDWETRVWRSIGRQRIPVRVKASTPDALAAFAGGAAARSWKTISERSRILRDRFGDSVALAGSIRSQTESLLQLDREGFSTVVEVAFWLTTHPVAGLRPRQLPIRGVDTKWFASHRALVTALYDAATGSSGLGVTDADRLIRIRVLDERLHPGGPLDFAAPLSELDWLGVRPLVVFVFENLESVLAMPRWEGAIAVHGSGYAVDVIGRISWVQRSPIVYWGDLDSHGFAILHRLRMSHSSVTSVLMDEATLLAHRDLWVPEPKPNRGTFTTLSESEQNALRRLHAEGDVRLEQERIPWQTALAALSAAV
ncbi:hypothetical protein B7R21_07555 [Subtercola boreus]|uniref:Wadjet protein JetD C-terminal domain-containing protein n=1 Tax=Subtercola boreus TaxID=120213 RepID=A0A3E0VX28_9MICO|nr:Wadjet anti-phage system protein JetD domain-containing protein [Subtercola boreus]RFA13908.1 hypothetical protein B7R21_07555 [Subtercola boreus]